MKEQLETLLAENEKLQEQVLEFSQLKEQIKELKEENRHLNAQNNALKGNITREVNKKLANERKKLQYREQIVEKKEQTIESYDIDELEDKIKEINSIIETMGDVNKENKEILIKQFEIAKNNINEELTQEFERFSEKDSDSDKTCGYLIGINKAKKIIRENLQLNEFVFASYEFEKFKNYMYEKKRQNILNRW